MLAIVFLSNTCQNTPVESENRVVTISVDTDDATVIPAVDKKSSYTEYGPGQTAQSTIKRDDKVTSNVGVIIGPSSGLNTDVMDYLSCVIKSDIKINFVTGLGNSSLVAALFSQTRKPELVKWKFFRLKEKEDISSIISELEINARSIKRSNTALYLSSMSQSKKLTLETKGNILKNLSYNFLNSGDIQKLASDHRIFILGGSAATLVDGKIINSGQWPTVGFGADLRGQKRGFTLVDGQSADR